MGIYVPTPAKDNQNFCTEKLYLYSNYFLWIDPGKGPLALLIGEGRISGICIDFVLTKLRENRDII